MFKSMACAACLGLFAFGTPAFADLALFERAFTGICLQNLPTLKRAPAQFDRNVWQTSAGADFGEYEFYAGTTSVFVFAADVSERPGCTVMDTDLSQLEAKFILELALDKYFPGKWKAGTDQNDENVWQLKNAKTITQFHTNEGLGGGSAISFSVHQ